MNRKKKTSCTKWMGISALALAFVLTAGPLSFGLPAADGPANLAEISKRVFPSVVRVEVQNGTRRVATGVVIEKGGIIVTSALVSPRDERIAVISSDGKRYEAEFLGFDTETQVALLRAKDAALPPVALGKVADLAPGSWIGVVGVSPERTAAVTQGIVSSVAPDKLRLNVWVTPGSSGSPVVDEGGRMVGLLRGIYMEERPVVFQFRDREQSGSGYVIGSRAEAPSSGMALAVPVDIVKEVSTEIKDKGKVKRGWLGVGIGEDERGRVEIGSVDKESPAALASLKEGDIVLRIDGRDIGSPDALASEIRRRKPGQDITLTIERDGKPMEVKVKLGEMPEAEARREMELRFPGLFSWESLKPKTDREDVKPEKAPTPPQPLRPFVRTRTLETRRFIGVYCEAINRELAEFFGVKEGTGLLVSRLTPDGPAEKAKVRVGDVIVRVDGKRVEAIDDLIDIVQSKTKGDKVKLEIVRDKKATTIEVEVAEEESGGFFGPEDFRGFLESWQGTADSLEKEIRKWQSERLPELRRDLKKIDEELAQKTREAAKDVKVAVRAFLRKV